MLLSGAIAWSGGAVFVASLLYFLYSYLVVFGRPAPAGGWIAPAIVDTALFSAFALHHSLFARTRVRLAVRRLISPHIERATYTWTASVLFLALCWLWRPVPGIAYSLEGPLRWIAYAVQLCGLVMTYLGSSAVDVLDLAGIRQVIDARRGVTPPRSRLHTAGVFRLVRHPIYFGWFLLVFGTPVMTGTRLVFAVVSTAYLIAAIPLEERSLLDVFGEEYAAYRRRVRWRMLPGLY